MTECARISDGLPAVLSAVLSAVGPAKAEGPAKAGGLHRISATAVSTPTESRVRPPIISNSINLVDIMIPSLQACLFPPGLIIFDENQPKEAK
jgi:hypothetical protein